MSAGARVLVTGSTSGIGLAIVRAFARDGAAFLVTGRDQERGEAVAETLSREFNTRVEFIPADLASADAVVDLAERATRSLGGIDVLVNNAAVMRASSTAVQDLGEFREMMAANILAPFVLVSLLAPPMADRGYGKIVNVGSRAVHAPSDRSAAYGSTKAALEFMTRAWAKEFGPSGVNVNTVSPGAIGATAAGSHVAFGIDEFAGRTIAGRTGAPDDVAAAVAFLASRAADYIHGATLPVDGGWTTVPDIWPADA